LIRLRALGALDLRDANGQELRTLVAQPRRAALLAYLALATPRGLHSRDGLLALFWPEQDAEHARNALSQALHFLKRSLGAQALTSSAGDALGLDWKELWCDGVAFEEALAAGRAGEALDLYRGDLLEGFHISNSAEFERWLDAERARYAGLYARALEAAADERERARDFAGALLHWKRLAARDPYNARVALRLMQSLAASGDAGAAVRHARLHGKLVQEELGMSADADVEAFVQQLQSAGPAKMLRPPARTSSALASHAIAADASGVPAGDVAAPSKLGRWRFAISAVLVLLVAAGAVAWATAGHSDAPPNEQYLRELYVRGRNAELSRSPLGIQTAKEAYRRAIDRDSTFALGYAGLAGVYGFIADYALGPAAPALDSARLMANRAVALDSTLPEAHTALAISLGDAGQFDASEREFKRAIELGSRNADAHYWYSVLLVALGRGDDALRESKRAEELEVVAPRGVLGMQRYAQWLLTGQRAHLKLPVAERRKKVLELEPGEPWARGRDAVDYAREGNCPAARSSIDRAQQLAPDNIRMLSFVGEVYWRCEERSRAESLVVMMKKRRDAREHGNRIAALYALFGEKDSAFVWLDHQTWTLPSLSALSADVFVDPLRDDQRFPRLLRLLGIRK
jgi:DNA-binding SARP family transcriptional activator/Flp pilus assembly protein TadD